MLFVIVFAYSTIKIILHYRDTNNNNKINDKIIKEVIEEKKNEENEKIDFNKLLSINPDIKGWIMYNNKKINYPIVQTNNNKYYLTHTFEKKYNTAGSIFIDYRNQNFDDKNLVMYGHSMDDRSMFGSLEDVDKNGFFENDTNNYIKIVALDNTIFLYQIFSYYIIPKEEYYITTQFSNESSYQKFINLIKERSRKDFNIDVNVNDKILTLSTCYGVGNTNNRRVIHAKKVENSIAFSN